MSRYIEQIRQLVALQHVDDGIHAVQQERENSPKEVEDLERRFQAQDSQREFILEKLQHLQEQQKRLDNLTESDEAQLKSSREKLMQVENAREYEAVLHEMETMERQNQNRGEERAALQTEISLQKDTLQGVEASWSELKNELETQKAGLEKRLAALQEKLQALEGERASVITDIPAPVLSRYDFIRDRLRHPVIVPVENGVCTGCHIAIPPQIFIDLQRGTHIQSCPNCQRLIYWAHHFQEGAEEEHASDTVAE